MYQQIKHFKGLNELRFFAAYLVLLHHAEQIRLKHNLFNLKDLSFFNNGGLAVTFFFVLSGFLISYLLLKEERDIGAISIKKFYVRRVLRIWPLYFLLVFFGTVLIPYLLNLIHYSYDFPYHFKDVILYYVFFSPFMVNILFGHHLLEPLWSIGVEEVFYILWAPLFRFFKKNILVIILSVIAFKLILLIGSEILSFPPMVVKVIKILKFESMAIGGLAAYLVYFRKTKIDKCFLFSKAVQVLLFLFLVGKFFLAKKLVENFFFFDFLYDSGLFSHLLVNCVFAWLIVNISLNKQTMVNIDNRVFNFLGEVSYGIYMYHMLVIFCVVLLLKKYLGNMSDIASTGLFYLLLSVGVFLMSYISKKIFEDYFLSFKRKFTPNKK